MPFYRVNGTLVHLKLTNTKKRPAPGHCLCDMGPGLSRCLAMATILCDFPVDGTTCDMPLCADHATEVGLDRHYCPRHAGQTPNEPELF